MNADHHSQEAAHQPQNSSAAPTSSSATHGVDVPDASTKEVLLYALGNVDNGIAGQFFAILQSLMVVAMRINPIVLGVILGIKTLWDAVTDPIMAHITDNFKSRWGRRRPFILVGGLGRSLLLLGLILWFPRLSHMASNRVLEGDKRSTELLALAEQHMQVLTNCLALVTLSNTGLAVRHVKDIERARSGYHRITNTYGVLMPDILDDYSQRVARLTTATHALVHARTTAHETVVLTKEQNRAYAETLVRNSQMMIDRMDKALAMGVAVDALARVVEEARGGCSAATLTAVHEEILATVGVDSMAPEVEAAAARVRLASQTLLATAVLAARGRIAPASPEVTENLSTAMVLCAEAEAVLARHEQALQDLLTRGEMAVARWAASNSTAELLVAGLQRGRALYARERVARVRDLLDVPSRCATNRLAASLIQKWRGGDLEAGTLRQRVEELLAPASSRASSAAASGTWQAMRAAWRLFWDPDNADTRGVAVYVLCGLLLFTTLTTIQSVPYYALGIELCPSYDGRTRVVTYRSIVDHIAGIIGPYVPVFCYLLIFHTALDGLLYVAVVACLLGVPATVLMVTFIRERMAVTISKRQVAHHMGIVRSFISLCRNPNFLRIIFLYNFLGIVQGMFLPLGGYLNIYWVMGSAGAGARIGAYVGTFCWVLGLINLPVLKWACQKFQKHVVMRWAVILMSIGMALNFFCLRKGHPEYQFIVPIFFSVGIASYYMVLATMMADVTDHDELVTGFRREGMFGAVNAFIIKITGTITAILPGVVLVLSGFDPVLEYNQTPETIMRMRILNSFVPSILTLGCLLVLWKYPLTRERVEEIKEVLRKRRAERAAMEAAASPTA